mgnify:CR=1 FL=1
MTPQPGTTAYRLHCRALLLAALDRQAAKSAEPERYEVQSALIVLAELEDLEQVSYPREKKR